MNEYLQANEYFDYDNPKVASLTQEIIAGVDDDPVQKAITLYSYVRDHYSYNPYQFSLSPDQLKASHCVEQSESYCIPKAVLLGAMCRSIGIPARLGLVDVKNHISSQKLLDLLKSDVFVMHGYVDLYLNNRWVKATPAFDSKLCHFLGIATMEFNGTEDSVFSEYNLDGAKHMEYLKQHGTFADVPVQLIYRAVLEAYPHLMEDSGVRQQMVQQSLEKDAELEQV